MHRRHFARGMAALGATAYMKPAFGASGELKLDGDLLDRMGQFFQSWVDAGTRAGYSMLVWQKGETVYEKQVGWEEIRGSTPIGATTKFRLASLTKPITTVAAMVLVERAALRLADPVANYIPEFLDAKVALGITEDGGLIEESPARPPTVADLMSHTAGIIGRTASPVISAKVFNEYRQGFFAPGTVEETVSRLARLPLIAHPGEAWTYGIFSSDVLGRVIEVASQMPLEDFIAESVLDPLAMHDTAFIRAGVSVDGLSEIYEHDANGRLNPVALHDIDRMPAASGGGGLVSTARDYARFVEMLICGGRLDDARILSPTSASQMSRNALPKKLLPISLEVTAPASGFGLGLGIYETGFPLSHSPLGEGDFWWAGSTDTYFVASPRHQLFGIILSQYAPNQHTRSWRTWSDFTALLYGALR